MKKRYMDAKAMTDSVTDLYMRLATLHKEGKENTSEYNDLLSLLPIAIKIEKEKYEAFEPWQSQINANMTTIVTTPKDNMYFMTINKDILSAIRSLNILDKSKLYALDGIVLRNDAIFKVHSYLEEAFYYEICMYLDKAKDFERDNLIDFKYGLLAASPELKDANITYPKSGDSMTIEEMRASETYILPKVNTLTDYLFKIKDENIRPHTITYILYVKACMRLLPPLYKSVITEELRNSINLQNYFGIITGDNYTEICDMLSYLFEESIKSNKKQEKINV